MPRLTKKDKEKIVNLFYEDFSSRETAKVVGCSKTSVLKIWKNNGLKNKRLPDEKVDIVLNNKDKYVRIISKMSGFCKATVKKILNKNNIRPKLKSELKEKQIIRRNKRILKDWDKGFSKEKISNNYSISHSMISNILRNNKNKINRPYPEKKKLSADDKRFIVRSYDSRTSSDIAGVLGINRGTVTKVWYDEGLQGKDTRQYYCNFDYFKDVNKPEKAYWLGFIMADGCVYKREGHQGLLQIILQNNDVEILQNFNDAIKSEYPINNIENKEGDKYCALSITSDEVCNSLIRVGIKPNKTWGTSLKLGKLPKKYWFDYLTGFFDGDGCISEPSHYIPSKVVINYVGNKNNIYQIRNVLNYFNVGCTVRNITKDKYTNDFYSLTLNNMADKYKFSKLYISRNYSTLTRKLKRFKKLVEWIEQNKTNRNENIEAVKDFNDL